MQGLWGTGPHSARNEVAASSAEAFRGLAERGLSDTFARGFQVLSTTNY